MSIQTHQGTAVLHHSSTKATSGNLPKSGCFRFRVAFFVSFLARQKRKNILLKHHKTFRCKYRIYVAVTLTDQVTGALQHNYKKQTWVSDTRHRSGDLRLERNDSSYAQMSTTNP